jgi:hypothetical protein
VGLIAEITGGTAEAAEVVKVKFVEVVDKLEELTDTTAKLYVVPAVKLLSVTECDVTIELFTSDCEP